VEWGESLKRCSPIKKMQDKKMTTQNLVTTDRATRETDLPTAVPSSNESLSIHIPNQLFGLVVMSMLFKMKGPWFESC